MNERFAYYDEKLTWDAARQKCTSRPGRWDLAVIDSDEEFHYLTDTYITDNVEPFWIGLTDSQQEGIGCLTIRRGKSFIVISIYPALFCSVPF